MDFDISKYKHVIWDWNGTLLDDAWLCVEILNTLLARRGMKPVTFEQYQQEFCFPVVDYYIKIGFDFDKEPFDAVANEYIELYDKRRFECKLDADATDVLKELKIRGKTQSILSAYHQKMLEEAVEYYGIRDYFTHLAGLDDYYAHSKIDNGKNLVAMLEDNKRDIVLIGDTIHDWQVANEIAVKCVLVSSGHCSAERLKTCGTCVVENIKDTLGKIAH